MGLFTDGETARGAFGRRSILASLARITAGLLLLKPTAACSRPRDPTTVDDDILIAEAIATRQPRIVRRDRPYHLTRPVLIPDGTTIVIEPGTRFLWAGSSGSNDMLVGVFEATGDDIAIEVEEGGAASVECSKPSPWVYAAVMRGRRGFTLVGIQAVECQHVHVTAAVKEWDRVKTTGTAVNVARDVHVTGGGARYVGSQSEGNGACHLQYVVGCTVRNARYDNVPHGVEWWGGNADPTNGAQEGKPGNERKCRDLHVSAVSVSRAGGGGIWGSMGEGVTVSDCIVDGAGDVAFDAEGSTDVTFERCMARNGRNGCFTTFFLCEGVRFISCVGQVDNKTFPLVRVYNATLSNADNKDLEIIGGRFECQDASGPGTIDTAMGPVQDIVIRDATLRNVRIDLAFHNMHRTQVLNNQLVFPYFLSGVAAIRVGSSKALLTPKGVVAGSTVVMGNRIAYISRTAPDGPTAISVREDDFNASATGRVADNVVSGAFATGIAVENASANVGIVPSFDLIGNRFTGLPHSTVLLSVRRGADRSHEPEVRWDITQTREGRTVGLRTAQE